VGTGDIRTPYAKRLVSAVMDKWKDTVMRGLHDDEWYDKTRSAACFLVYEGLSSDSLLLLNTSRAPPQPMPKSTQYAL
jgi:hypothetical protein